MPSKYGAIRASTQHALIEFLHAELNLGATFVKSARLARIDGHMDHYEQARGNSLKAIESIKKFMLRSRTNEYGKKYRVDLRNLNGFTPRCDHTSGAVANSPRIGLAATLQPKRSFGHFPQFEPLFRIVRVFGHQPIEDSAYGGSQDENSNRPENIIVGHGVRLLRSGYH
jgi:hypothetical protein